MSTIYLIRHGKTAANEKHLYCGSTDLPLAEAGIAELKELRNSYSDCKGYHFVTSGMLRTEQTLELLFGEVSRTVVPEFREMDFGVFEMHSYEELKKRGDYQQWLEGNNEANATPNGESGAEMQKRVLKAFKEQMERDENTVIITHGGPIAAIMEAVFPNEHKNRYEWQPKPGHGYAVTEGWYWNLP